MGSDPTVGLDRWMAAVGWGRLLNQQGTTWRKLDDSVRQSTHDQATARRLMLSQPSVIKRPVVEWGDGRITVGFSVEEWAAKKSA